MLFNGWPGEGGTEGLALTILTKATKHTLFCHEVEALIILGPLLNRSTYVLLALDPSAFSYRVF